MKYCLTLNGLQRLETTFWECFSWESCWKSFEGTAVIQSGFGFTDVHIRLPSHLPWKCAAQYAAKAAACWREASLMLCGRWESRRPLWDVRFIQSRHHLQQQILPEPRRSNSFQISSSLGRQRQQLFFMLLPPPPPTHTSHFALSALSGLK